MAIPAGDEYICLTMTPRTPYSEITEQRPRRPGRSRPGPESAVVLTFDGLKRSLLYSEELGIKLGTRQDGELFKWFLASMLYGARISEKVSKHTYEAFAAHNLLAPEEILHAGWDFLIDPIMRTGGYVRYDGKTSTKILKNCETLIARYRGRLSRLHEEAEDAEDLEKKITDFYGIGPVTVNIFLRELRPYWKKDKVGILPAITKLALAHGLDITGLNRSTLSFVRIEAGLIRLRKELSPGKEDYSP